MGYQPSCNNLQTHQNEQLHTKNKSNVSLQLDIAIPEKALQCVSREEEAIMHAAEMRDKGSNGYILNNIDACACAFQA